MLNRKTKTVKVKQKAIFQNKDFQEQANRRKASGKVLLEE